MSATVQRATQGSTTAEEGELNANWTPIERLQEQGINAADIKKLKEAGLHTVQRVTMTTRKDLSAIKGMSDAKIDKLIEAAMKLCENTFLTGAQALEKRKSVIKITTGSKALDDLVGGGIETMSLTEVFGEFRTGKSQLSHTLCVSCQLDVNEGGAAGKAIYIDTEGCFRPEKIMEIAERFGLDSDDVLNNILHARVHNHEQQMNIIPLVAAKMSEDTYRVLVIDSITALFRADFSGRGELAERQQKLQKHLSMLTKLADEFNVAVFITNQVISDPGGGSVFVQDPKKPAGGHVLAHASTTRLYLRKGRAEQRIAKVYDSPLVAENECVFQLSGQGIIDAKD